MVKNKFKLPKTFFAIILCTSDIQPPTVYSPSLIEAKHRSRFHDTTNLFCLLLIAYCLLAFTNSTYSTIRYVSTTGSSIPPFLTWETAADSIQKCIDFSVNGDTIIVANGVYYESLVVDKYLWLIGSSMDSCIIDGTGLDMRTVRGFSDFHLTGFHIIGKNQFEHPTYCISNILNNSYISNSKLSNASIGLSLGRSSGEIENVWVFDILNNGVTTFCSPDTCSPKIKNSIFIMEDVMQAILLFDGGNTTITNNIILDIGNSSRGIGMEFGVKSITIKNNIVTGFGGANIYTLNTTDTAIVENNIATHQTSSI